MTVLRHALADAKWNRLTRNPSDAWIPATRTAVGSPPEGIVQRVRQWGESHAGYKAYVVAPRAEKRRKS